MGSPENPGEQESIQERICTREEIVEKITSRCENPEVIRELSDEQGIYLLEVRSKGEDPNEGNLYLYKRRKEYTAGNEAPETCLEVVYYSGGDPCGGDTLASLNPETGEWVDK